MKTFEREMKKAFLYKNLDNYQTQYLALLFAFIFWIFVDEIMNDNKADIFNSLYLNPKNFGNTYVKLSLDLHISLRTLERYRKQFVLSFQFILNFIQKYNIKFNPF